MILYLDASAAVKRYVAEHGSAVVRQAIATATVVGMVIIGRVEIVAAFAKAVRVRSLTAAEAETVLRVFRTDWPDYVRIRLTSSPRLKPGDSLNRRTTSRTETGVCFSRR